MTKTEAIRSPMPPLNSFPIAQLTASPPSCRRMRRPMASLSVVAIAVGGKMWWIACQLLVSVVYKTVGRVLGMV